MYETKASLTAAKNPRIIPSYCQTGNSIIIIITVDVFKGVNEWVSRRKTCGDIRKGNVSRAYRALGRRRHVDRA